MLRNIVVAVLFAASTYFLWSAAGWKAVVGVWLFGWAMNIENQPVWPPTWRL